jgi:hypothetical protein
MQDEIIKFADICCEEMFENETFQSEYNRWLDEMNIEAFQEQQNKD